MARIAYPRGSSSRHACAHKSNQTSIKPQLQTANTTTLSSPPLLLCLDCSYRRTSEILLGLRPTRALVAPFFKCTGKHWREQVQVRTPDESSVTGSVSDDDASIINIIISVCPSVCRPVCLCLFVARARTLSLCVQQSSSLSSFSLSQTLMTSSNHQHRCRDSRQGR